MERKPRSRLMLVVRSLWYWDLQIAVAIGALAGLLWFTDTVDVGEVWGMWAATAAFVLIGLSNVLWKIVKGLMEQPDYAFLLSKTTDGPEGAKASYTAARIVALASFGATGAFYLAVGSVGRTTAGVLFTLSAWILAWAVLALVSISIHYRYHQWFAASAKEHIDDIRASLAEQES